MRTKLVCVINHKVKKPRSVLYALDFVRHFDHKGDVVNRHAPPEIVPDQSQAKSPVKIPSANVLASWIWRPNASPRGWGLVKEAVFAVEEEFGETWSWSCGSVVVSEAEGVSVAVGRRWGSIGCCHVFRCVLAVVQVSRIVSGRCVLAKTSLRSTDRNNLGSIAGNPVPDTFAGVGR